MHERTRGLNAAAAHAERFLLALDERPVEARANASRIRETLGAALAERGEDPEAVIEALAVGADDGIVASAGPRHFGFVIGGALPAALAADWLVSAWDQCAAFHSLSPAAAAIEEIVGGWILDLLGLPAGAGVGFVTGGQAANTTGLAAARHAVLARCGWDVEQKGLVGAPQVNIVCGEQAHATLFNALRLLGLGAQTATRIPVDAQGRMVGAALEESLRSLEGPTIVCAQAGNVATGAFDPFEPIAAACAARGAWLHVDGAFGLWAAAAPSTRALVRGVERADSWAVDAHKWLNVPYDSAMAIVADADVHRAAMGLAASYLVADPAQRDSTNYVRVLPPGASRSRVRRPTLAGAQRSRRAGRAQLRPRPPDGRPARRDPARARPQRRGPQSGAGGLRGGRRGQSRRGGRRAARGHLLARRHRVGGASRDAPLVLELVDDGRRRRPLSRRNRGCSVVRAARS